MADALDRPVSIHSIEFKNVTGLPGIELSQVHVESRYRNGSVERVEKRTYSEVHFELGSFFRKRRISDTVTVRESRTSRKPRSRLAGILGKLGIAIAARAIWDFGRSLIGAAKH